MGDRINRRQRRAGQAGTLVTARLGAGLLILSPATALAADETAYIPLHMTSETQTATIAVSVGGGAETEVLLDTGSNGLRISSASVGPDVTVSDIAITYSYGSGLLLNGYLTYANVTFTEAVTPDGQPLTTAQPIAFQYVTNCTTKTTDTCKWPTTTTGIMGVGYENLTTGPNDLPFNPLAQLPGNFASGFIIQGWNTSGAVLTVGLTADNTSGFIFEPLSPSTTSSPPDGTKAWNTTVATCFQVNGATPICDKALLDTGQTVGHFDGAVDPSILTPDNRIEPGNSVAIQVGALPTLVITTSDEENGDSYQVTDEERGNTGQLIYQYYTIAFDAMNGRLGFAPLMSLIYGDFYPTSDADFGASGTSVGLDATLHLKDSFTSSRAFLLGSDAVIQVEDGATATLAGTLSGGNGLHVEGPGTLVLRGLNTYSGGTFVTGATLNVTGDGALGGAGEGLALDNATLGASDGFYSPNRLLQIGSSGGQLTSAGVSTWGGAISGDSTLHVKGGTWNFTGSGGTDGGIHVDDGATLAINGDFSGAYVLVHGGATLMGTGQIGASEVAGILSPGNSIGTLSIHGTLAMVAGSTLAIELDPDGASDKVEAKDAVTIDDATLALTLAAGTAPSLGSYTVITSDTGVSGSGFTSITGPFGALYPFLEAQVETSARALTVDIARNDTPFASVATTRNQRAVAGALDRLPVSTAIAEDVAVLTAPQARGAFTALSGEIHATTSTMLLNQSTTLRQAVLDHARVDGDTVPAAERMPLAYAAGGTPGRASTITTALAAPAPRPDSQGAFWAEAFGDNGSIDATTNTAAVSTRNAGLLVGYDRTFASGWRLGFASGYSGASYSAGDIASSGSTDNYHLAAYGGVASGPWSVNVGGLFTWSDVSTNRNVQFPGVTSVANADYTATTGQVFGEVAYGTKIAQIGIAPFAGLAYVNLEVADFQEKGGGALLHGFGDNRGVTYSTLGTRTSIPLPVGLPAELVGMLAWQHAFGDLNPVADLGFGAGLAPFSVTGAPIAEDAALVEAGLQLQPMANASLRLTYSGQLAADTTVNAVKGSATLRF